MKRRHYLMVTAACTVLAFLLASARAQESVPRYELDPSWPKLPLPEGAVVGDVGGMCIDLRNDHVFILSRPDTFTGRAASNLTGAPAAPIVIELDADGKMVNGWGDPKLIDAYLHDCDVDQAGNVWVMGAHGGHVQKYSHDGTRLLLQLGKSGVFDSSDGTAKGKPLNSNAAQFFFPAGVTVDPQNGDIYVADGEGVGGNSRVAVMDRAGKFLRQWQLNRDGADKNIRPVPHCIGMSRDGLVYVCDRQADQVQVFDKMGNLKKKIAVPWKRYDSTKTGGGGSAVALDFSPDPNQRYLYVANQPNEKIDVLDRDSGKVLTSLGRGAGHFPGQFDHAHGIAVDSKGNVYVAEVDGRRVQKFRAVGR
ncbi:MAG TPA: beta-propeller fold lactonase family protein [Terriglobia bacterium]|nr:beta-propeller fold lactonase family protein [Terriglobia bacterium]